MGASHTPSPWPLRHTPAPGTKQDTAKLKTPMLWVSRKGRGNRT
jgi:hypothetical protein